MWYKSILRLCVSYTLIQDIKYKVHKKTKEHIPSTDDNRPSLDENTFNSENVFLSFLLGEFLSKAGNILWQIFIPRVAQSSRDSP